MTKEEAKRKIYNYGVLKESLKLLLSTHVLKTAEQSDMIFVAGVLKGSFKTFDVNICVCNKANRAIRKSSKEAYKNNAMEQSTENFVT